MHSLELQDIMMIWKSLNSPYSTFTLLSLAVFVVGDGHATSEQKVIMRSKPQYTHHGDLKHYGSHKPEYHEEYAWSYPSYEFFYKVDDPHTYDKKGQHESREGDEVKGEYWLYEPDGRKRTVEYHSDKKTGFKAIVKYSAPHKHDHHEHQEHKHEDKKDDDSHKMDHDDKHHEKHHEKHHDDAPFEIMKVHKHDDHKKDDHHEDEHHDEEHDHHDNQRKAQHGYRTTKNDDHDDKRGYFSQVLPYFEQYRPFPYRQVSIQYDAPFEQQNYRKTSKQY